MLIAKLTISYDRGVARNDENDVKESLNLTNAELPLEDAAAPKKPAEKPLLRGLGTHFKSAEDMDLVKQRDFAARNIYTAFRQQFIAAPIEGLYFVERAGQAKAFVAGLEDVREDMQVRVSEFELSAPQDLEQAEMAAWGKRIKNQLASISLGRSKEADEAGLSALLALAKCPVLQKGTRVKINAMVNDLRTQKITRVELKRSLDKLDVQVETSTLAPRRTPSLMEAA